MKETASTRKRAAIWAAVVLSLVWMYQGGLVKHMTFAADPLVFNDDVRQFVWLYLVDKQDGRPDDFIYDYRRAAMPVGYSLLYRAAARLGDPRTFSKVLPYLLMLVLLLTTAYTASRLGGGACAWAAMAFVLSSGIFLDRMTGGLPRAFAFPILAGMACALVTGRPKYLAGLTVLGAAFYPIVAALGGTALAVWMCLDPKDRGEAAKWPARMRWRLVAATGALAFIMVLPTMLAMRRFAPQMRPSDIAAYPEYGPAGRYRGESDRPPFGSFVKDSMEYFRFAVEGTGYVWSLPVRRWGDRNRYAVRAVMALLFLAGTGLLALRESSVRRLLLLPVVLLPLYVLAKAVAPTLYLPQRYIVYTMPLMAVLLLPAALSALPRYFKELRKKDWAPPATVVSLCVLQFLFLGARGPDRAGFNTWAAGDGEIYVFLERLSPDSVVAGWPGPKERIENVPYLSAKTAFLTLENHEVYYRGYADEMRKRMRALIDAYYATGSGPLLRLREEFGVTHLIVDKRHLTGSPAAYFKPFGAWVTQAYLRAQKTRRGFETGRQFKAAHVYEDGTHFVLDLGRLKI